MNSYLKNILFIFLCCTCRIAVAQDLKFKHIGLDAGLSNSTIECIIQDHRGFIWFGTRDGLNKYDGLQITVYRNSKDKNSLSDNFIRHIYEDKNKKLWIGTSRGLNCFDPESNSFKRYPSAPLTKKFPGNNDIRAIEEYGNGLWIASLNGPLAFLNTKTNAISRFNYQTNDIHTDKKGNLWIATDKGLYRYDTKKAQFQMVGGLSSYNLRVIAGSGDGTLWLGTEEQGMIAYQPRSGNIKRYRHEETNANSLGSDLVRAIVVDESDQLWIGGINGGLDHFNPRTAIFKNYQNEPGNTQSLSQRTVSAICRDRQNNLWVGTHRGGVNLYTPGAERFKLVQQELNKNSLSYNDVKAFFEDENGNLWIGTDGGGLNFYDRQARRFSHYKFDPFRPMSLGSNAVLSITEDRFRQLWIGTWAGGLNLMNKTSGTFTRFTNNPANPNSISSNYVQTTFEDSKGNLWIGTYYGGLNLMDRGSKTFSRLVQGANNTKISGENIISINEDQHQNLWIGTDDGGLNCYNLNSKIITHYFLNEENRPDLRIIFIDSKKRLWIGQAGLYLFNPTKNSFSIYTTKAGLSTDFIKGITEDDLGNFWIATSRGLTRFNPETLRSTSYSKADGLQGQEFEANAFLKTKKGEMFFGGVNGFNSFFPEAIKTSPFSPPVYITEFQIFNNKMLPGAADSPLEKDISFTNDIVLSHKQSTFSFSFAGLNYTAAQNNKYAYKLEGLDKEWNYAGNTTKAFYTNLDPGDYTFTVKASNNDDNWNTKGTSVHIRITPPFWATWWFRMFIACVVTGIAYVLLSFKRKMEIRAFEEKKREEMHQIQLQFFTNISHEFRTPLSLILGPIDRLLKEDSKAAFLHYYKTIHRNANRLLSLIDELMDFRKIESGALQLKVMPGNINLFIEEVAEEFSEMAKEKQISFRVKQLVRSEETWFDRQVIEKIVLNLINNSLKYTRQGGEVLLEILDNRDDFRPMYENQLSITNPYQGKQYVYIRVADSGIGISKESINHLFERYYRITESHLGSGVGLAFVKSLAMLHKGKIQVSSERHQGTEIIIGVPCSKSDYQPEEFWGQSNEQGGTRLESISYKSDPFLPADIPQPTEATLLNKHILIVDDNEELRSFLKDTLSPFYEISEAEDGYEGLQTAKEKFPDLVISDVMMPGMTGTQFCKALKEDLETSHIPFLMLTAKNSVEAEIEGAESGADMYFSKPININLLLINIKNILEQRQKLKDHYLKNHQADLIELVHSSKDKEFMETLLNIINGHLINPEMDIDFLCSEIGMSRTKLYQKIKTITGQSIGEFIRSIRLRKAVEIMTQEDVLLTEVMYRVGIQTQSYFTKAFKKEFGKTPTQYLQSRNK
ncbi:two-component system sensor histidine kinase/response [Pedobacter sp. BAL39]|uniref:hybrid sensor histidine kinase/response regulator transcription factor n=1 Tax=Pedobacter sp. BAL39 TaxID=391596 RepID=UPI000155A28D|nr:hybrid sensor histidine kinase/response regulator transcription factor [Pedobacter sp. BAL39]EDM34646.1 two-component system sensor histidine kinase/response [Pedobacter sp. BAL39]